jgi:hypothetical protein
VRRTTFSSGANHRLGKFTPSKLPERKAEGLHSRVGKLYLELAISYPCLLTHELVRPLTSCRTIPSIIDIGSVRITGRLSVNPSQ